MKKRWISLVLASAMALGLMACAQTPPAAAEAPAEETAEAPAEEAPAEEAPAEASAADSDVAYIQEKGSLIVGITDFAPMDYKDENGEWIGFDADLARKVAESLGVEVQFIEIDWDNKILELENKSIDVVWNGMTLTPEVTEAMTCTGAYLNNAQVVVLPADKAGEYADVESLKGLAFAVEAGSAGEAAATENGFEFTAVTTQADTLMEVSAGTSDASIIDLLMAGAMIGEGTSYPDLVHTVELTTEEYGVGCRKGSDLAAYIDGVLDGLYADGTLDELGTVYGVQEAIVERAAAPAGEAAAEEAAPAEAAAEAPAADSDVAYIQEKGTLIVGITDFAPMDYKDENGEWIGFDADLAKLVAADLGVAVEFVEIDWDNKILELENKSIDVVWNGMTLTPEVTNAMECTKAYLNNAQVVVLPADKAGEYADVESLKGLAFAVEAGSAGEAAAAENGFDYTAITTQADTLMEIAAGTSDASIIDLLMAGAMIGEGTSYPDLTHTVELTTEEYGVGCRKGSDLAAFINDELAKFYADGTMEEIGTVYGVQEAIIAQ